MPDASKMQSTFLQGVENTVMPGRIVEPKNFPSPVEGNFPLISDVLPLCKEKHGSYNHARIFGTRSEGKIALKKCYPYKRPAATIPPYNWGRRLRVVISLKHPRDVSATVDDLCFLTSSTAAQIAYNQTR